MQFEEFKALVAQEVDAIPPQWAARLDNVAFLVDGDSPADGEELLGLYQGIPMTERGDDYSLVLPDTITLFWQPIVREAQEHGLDVRTVIRETLWHEIAHYFGFDEEMVESREDEGSNRFRPL